MTLRWSGWITPETPTLASPYVDWFRTTRQPGDARFRTRSLALPEGTPAALSLGPQEVPLPATALPVAGAPVLPPEPLWPQPRPDAVIVGVIDTALALAHERFRHGDGSTRFLAAWQQGASWTGQPLPFGRELRAGEIDRLMQQAIAGGTLDEAAFNLAAGLTSFADPLADREIERAASHGIHVLDLAAGFDPAQPDPVGQRERMALLAVTLPPRPSIGAAGNFLEFLVIHAIRWIVASADAIWQQHYAATMPGRFGFPVVINLSYGLQAGPKDGTMALERFIRALVDERRQKDCAPLRIVLPAGNDNLECGQARVAVKPAGSAPLTWRLVPEDRTPNYLEIWTETTEQGQAPFALQITPPGAAPLWLSPGRPGQYCDLTESTAPDQPLARIYCRSVPGPDGSGRRMNHVICTRSTSDETAAAPAGAWTVRLKGAGGWAQLFVQSDQSLIHGAATGLLSYFDHPDYRRFDEDSGRVVDTTDYPPPGRTPIWNDAGPVRRLNTLNAIASLPDCITVAGYRASDGRPVPYSSSGCGAGGGVGRAAPTAALPADDGAARFGLLAAGAKSGSVLAMQGTSFATALATRMVAVDLLDWSRTAADSVLGAGSAAWMERVATLHEASGSFPGDAAPAKIGAGRLPAPALDRIPRSGRG